jgi:hypothetical protein
LKFTRRTDASFNPNRRRLTIFARGHSWQELVPPILCALAAHHLALARRRDQNLSDADAKKLSHLVAPYAEQIINQAFTPDAALPVG